MSRDSSISVLSFNMQHGQTWDAADPDAATIDLGKAIDELRRHDADVVLLQEVERVCKENGQIQPPPNYTILCRELPQYHGYFSYPPDDSRELPFGYGLAILCKNPLHNTEAIDLPAPHLEFEFKGEVTQPTERLMIGARTRFLDHEIQLYNTHLQAFFILGKNSDDFPEQRDVIAERLRQAKQPTILGGDFNSAPEEGTVDTFESVGFRTAQREQPTWKRKPFVLDHIFFNRWFELEQSRVHRTLAADHDIVVASLRLTGGPSSP